MRRRRAWFDGAQTEAPVYAWAGLGAGSVVRGPAFVESEQTTVVVYPRQQVQADEGLNLHMSAGQAPGAAAREASDAVVA